MELSPMRHTVLAIIGTLALANAAGAGTSAAEQKWRAEQEQAMAEEARGHTPKLTAACGHDVTITFDWKSIKQKDWPEKPGISYVGPLIAGGNVLYALEELCGDKAYKKKAAKIKTLVIHGRTCEKLPRDYRDGD